MGNKASTRESICACLYDDRTVSKGQTAHIQRKKVRPLLCDLEKDFKSVQDKDGKVSAKELSMLWQRAAERKVGKLTTKEVMLMNDSARLYVDAMDIDHDGRVDFDEFSMWMMGDYKEHAVLHRIRGELSAAPDKKDLTVLKEITKIFNKYDVDRDGFVNREELIPHLEDIVAISNRSSSNLDLHGQQHGIPDPAAREMAKELIKQVEISPEGRIDLWEVLAHALGRRKTPVELLLYDISDGVSKKFSPLLLGRSFEAIYHSGVLVFGSEYWYGGGVFCTLPPNAEQFGEPLRTSVTGLQPSQYDSALLVVPLGYTLSTLNEFHTFINEEMMPKYTHENYDVLTHNCNDFSNEVVKFLSGYGIPREVRNLPELVMSTPTAKLLRPVLNKWLGGFQDKRGQIGKAGPARRQHSSVEKPKELRLFTGDIVHVDLTSSEAGAYEDEGEVLASIISQDKETVEIEYFDMFKGELVILKGVQRDRVRRRTEPTEPPPALPPPLTSTDLYPPPPTGTQPHDTYA